MFVCFAWAFFSPFVRTTIPSSPPPSNCNQETSGWPSPCSLFFWKENLPPLFFLEGPSWAILITEPLPFLRGTTLLCFFLLSGSQALPCSTFLPPAIFRAPPCCHAARLGASSLPFSPARNVAVPLPVVMAFYSGPPLFFPPFPLSCGEPLSYILTTSGGNGTAFLFVVK